jgi:thymidylate synthase ThyX
VTVCEQLTAAEQARLAPFVTDLQAPVFALRNLPETTRGALFARYSRYGGTLRRLMLEEFGDELDRLSANLGQAGAYVREGRSEALYERVLAEYGDDSVAQLGGAHVACEWCSNLLTKIIERPRLGAYLEQSTRYIPYDRPGPDGRYRYRRSPELGERYEQAMDELFATYSTLLEPMRAWLAERFPSGSSPRAHERAVRAKALDLLRGLLPAATLSHVGVFASGQTHERLVLHLLADPLPEAQACGEGLLGALEATIPAFVSRVRRDDRGGRWLEHLRERAAAERSEATALGLRAPEGEQPAGVRLLGFSGSETELLAALLAEGATISEELVRARILEMTEHERAEAIARLVGPRENRRHLPGRGFEALRYRFEIVSDYGAFRDLQRHRMLTVQWQGLAPHLGADVPEEVQEAGLADPYSRALERSREAWQQLHDSGLELQAAYALCMAYRIRYVLDLDAREAIHLIELRSARQGHATYRSVAREMHRLVATVHPAVAAAMSHFDEGEGQGLERLGEEIRGEAGAAPAGPEGDI